MTTTKIRGYALTSSLKWCKDQLEPADHRRVMDALPDDFQEAIADLRPGAWYPASWFDSLTLVVVATADEQARDGLLADMGKFIGEDNLGSVLKLLIMFIKPAMLLGRLPQFFRKYYDSPQTTTRVERDEDNGGGTCYIEDFGAVELFGPVVEGWARGAFVLAGVEDPGVTVTVIPGEGTRGPTFRVHIRWS